MSKNVYNSIFQKMKQIGIIDANGVMQHSYFKFTCEGLMDLNVDNLLQNRIALAHNGIQNGDVMADPDVEVQVYPEKQEAEPLSFQNDYLGIYQQVYDDGKCNVRLKKDIAIFVDDWLSNIINCEYKLIEKED